MNLEEILEKIINKNLKSRIVLNLSISVKRGLANVDEEVSEISEMEEIKKICSPNDFYKAFMNEHSDQLKF